ncbi:MAG: hypothetical protein K1X50_16425 [Candidatus Promineofilum sp.]|nr:hypothetical protein [Promineifilum sp.]MCW5863361.1 hypothetical protein [Anaerolineae bacterium]
MRVFLRKPKWLTYLLLFIILIQVLPPFARYYLGSDEWVKYQSTSYGFAIQYPGNWTPESYQGSSPGLEGVVAILADSPGFIEASRLLTIYRRPADQPTLTGAADWGRALTESDGGYDYSPVTPTEIGAGKLPAWQQTLRYDQNHSGQMIYLTDSQAEYVLSFSYRDDRDDSTDLFLRMLATWE